MASNGTDPITGAKKFPEEDAPQIGADLEEVSEQAVFLGTRPMGSTADRNAYAFAREGLRWYDTTLKVEYLHDGSGWKPWESDWIVYTPGTETISVGSGGSSLTEYKYEAGRVVVHFRYVIGTGASITGALRVATPSARAAVSPASFVPYVGEAHAWDQAATITRGLFIVTNGSSSTVAQLAYGTSTVSSDVTSSAPFTPVTNSVYEATFTYDPA